MRINQYAGHVMLQCITESTSNERPSSIHIEAEMCNTLWPLLFLQSIFAFDEDATDMQSGDKLTFLLYLLDKGDELAVGRIFSEIASSVVNGSTDT